MSLFSRGVLALTHNPVVRRAVTGTRPGRALAQRFVAGDDLEAAMATARRLTDDGMHVSLDLLGEEVQRPEQAASACAKYIACIDRIGSAGLAANISIKLTQLGLALDPALASDLVDRLARRAGEVGTTVTIDMEGSRYTQATLDLYAELQPRHGNLGVCVQAYLRRTPDDLERLLPLGGHIRLCKGAYTEPPQLAFQSRSEVNAAFARLLEPLMRAEGVRPAIATHDDRLLTLARALGAERSQPWEVQTLYGVRPRLASSLVAAGENLRVYVPYGGEWYPYLTRRLAERPANLAFFLRALAGRG